MKEETREERLERKYLDIQNRFTELYNVRTARNTRKYTTGAILEQLGYEFYLAVRTVEGILQREIDTNANQVKPPLSKPNM